MPTPEFNLDSYLEDFEGAAMLVVAAQDVTGDDRNRLLDLAAEAWRDTRRRHGVYTCAVYVAPLTELEGDVLEDSGVTDVTFCELSLLYLEHELALVRNAQRRLAATPLQIKETQCNPPTTIPV